MQRFLHQGSVSWNEVVEGWRKREEEIWREHYMERGFTSWIDWRSQWIKRLHLDWREWKRYEIENPYEMVPNFLVGAFTGWWKYYPPGERIATFADIAEHPDLPENAKVAALRMSFPVPTEIIGLRMHDQIVVHEGVHRSAAIALTARDGLHVPLRVSIVMTEFEPEERDLFMSSYIQDLDAPASR